MRTLPGGANPNLLPGCDTGPEVLYPPQPGQENNQKEPNENSGLNASKEEIWGIKRRTFVIALGILVFLIIGAAAGVGWGVGVTSARGGNNNNGALETTKSKSQDSSSKSQDSSSYVSWNVKTCSSSVL